MRKMTLSVAFVAIAAALAIGRLANAQSTMQFPTTPWGGFAPARIQCGKLLAANFNSTADQAIPVSVPSATYIVDNITVSNPSISLDTAQGGFYSAASKGGVAIVANSQAYSTLTTNTADTTGNAMAATIATAGSTTAFGKATARTIYLSLTTAQGAAATADVRLFCRPMY